MSLQGAWGVEDFGQLCSRELEHCGLEEAI